MTQKIIALNGGKSRKSDNGGNEDGDEFARLIVEGEEFELDSFILSGQGRDQKRLLFTWNCSFKIAKRCLTKIA